MLKIISVIIFMTQLSIPLSAQEQETGQKSEGYHQSDDFFLRFQLGPGNVRAVTEYTTSGATTDSGWGAAFRMQIGGIIFDNLALFGNFGGFSARKPTTKRYDSSYKILEALVLLEVGVGLSYYFMPVNIYLSGTIGLGAAIQTAPDSSSGGTEFGPSLHISLGKEWWISKNWGIGVAIYHYINVTEAETIGGAKDVLNQSFGLYLSATYN